MTDVTVDDAAGQLTEQWYTVNGLWWQTKERVLFHFLAASPEMAEELAHAEAAVRSANIGVTGVFEGKLDNVDQARWVDPSAETQEDMDQVWEAAYYARPLRVERVEAPRRGLFGMGRR